MKKIILFLLAAALILVGVVIFFKDFLIKTAFEKAVTGLTGFPTTIEKIGLQLPGTVHLKGLKILNPKGFQNEIFADIPEIYISLDPFPIIFKELILFHEVRLNISELNIEKNASGISNVSLLSSLGQKNGAQIEKRPEEKRLPFLLQRFELTLRRIRYQDSSGVVPQNISVDMKVDRQVFANIQDPRILVNLILMKIVSGTTFGNLIGVSPQFLQDSIREFASSGAELLSQSRGFVTTEAGKMMNPNFLPETAQGVVTDTVGTATSTLTQASDLAKNKISGLFGKVKSTLGAQDQNSKPSS